MADLKKHDDDLAADHDQDDEARRRRLKAAAAREELEEEEDDEEEEEEEEEEDSGDHDGDDRENDPTWWLPHAVMGTLIFLGILGVLGVFPRVFGPKKAAAESTTGATTAAAAATTASPASSLRLPTRPIAPPGETISAQHLLVMHKEGMRPAPGVTRTKEEAKKRAEEALDKLKKGTAFDALVKEYTDEPGSKDKNPPGDLGTFGKGRMVPAFETAAFALKPNETSGVVESPFGYHIIRRLK